MTNNINDKNNCLTNKQKINMQRNAKELEKWDNRVIYNVRFKDDTKAPLDKLDDILFNSLQKFTIIAANSEALVYKIGRYFISQDVKNDEITFIDGKIVESYIGDESKDWKKKDRVDEFFETFGEDCKGKWVIIPFLSFEISIGLSIYFISQFKKYSAIGIIFYAEGPNNLVEVLSLNSDDPNFYEFPKKEYRKRKRLLPDDEW